ncbi:Maf1, partial [Symbiodinium microadriaticum]
MKYLENPGLEAMSNFLTGREMGGCILDGRIEAFSCKRAGEDKKLSKVLEAKLVEDLTMDPPVRKRSTSLGDLSEVSTRRLLIDLISTLNASFPDYDFSTATPDSFVQRDLKFMLQNVNSYLAELTASNGSILEELWRAVDEVIVLRECEIFSYVPDMNEDPFSDGILWSFNFFVFNKELKRLCYFTCLAR